MRWVVFAIVTACGDPEPIGEVTVNVRTNTAFGETMEIPPMPIAGAYVFADDTDTVQTDASGNATIAVVREASTIHVLAEGFVGHTVYTLVSVPVGAAVAVGGRPISQDAGTMRIDLPAISGATYDVRGPSPCVREGAVSATPSVPVTFRASCAGATVHVYGFAVGAGATQFVEADVTIEADTRFTVPGPYTDAASYMLAMSNLPEASIVATVQLGVVSPDGAHLTALGNPVTATDAMATLVAPATADTLIVRQRASTWIARGALPPGANALDAAPMLPIPGDAVFEGRTATWSYDAGGRDLDGMVLEAEVKDAPIRWVVHGGATTTSATFPALPADAGVEPGTELSAGSTIVFYSIAGDRTFDVDAVYDEWFSARALPAGDLAITGRF